MAALTRTKAEIRADIRWSRKSKNEATPWPCGFCSRAFASERGRDHHRSFCFTNPNSRRFTVGGYDGQGKYAITHLTGGRVTGLCWRGKDELDEARIRASMSQTLRAIGVRE